MENEEINSDRIWQRMMQNDGIKTKNGSKQAKIVHFLIRNLLFQEQDSLIQLIILLSQSC